jgi:serine/threonine-protein kinase
MATVYLAEDLKHDRRVAVKVLRPDLAAALGPERFLREIQIAAVLAHPHILPLHDSGEADGFVFYVMPYVEEETLRDQPVRERQLPIEEAVRIAGEVADGLAHAHSLGLVHRDIKPENILFMGGHAVVADFGVATAVGVAGGERAYDEQSPWIGYLSVDPRLDRVHTHARLKSLLRKARLGS